MSKLLQIRFNLENEKALQIKLDEFFTSLNIDHNREVRLNARDIIDFMVDDIGIEVKIKGSGIDIYKQCMRYCESDQLKHLILVTNKAINLPNMINNKDVYIVNLGKAWL